MEVMPGFSVLCQGEMGQPINCRYYRISTSDLGMNSCPNQVKNPKHISKYAAYDLAASGTGTGSI
jgi:hypothetical protein